MHKIMQMCTACKYFAEPYVPCDGVPTANILVLGESPGKEEIVKGVPFVGPSGKLLRSALGNTECLICNAFPCMTKDFDFSIAERCFRERFPNRFKHVITVGRVAQILVERVNERFDNVHFIYHPAYVLRGGMRESVWRESVEKCLADIHSQ